jgi:hypothetical protein
MGTLDAYGVRGGEAAPEHSLLGVAGGFAASNTQKTEFAAKPQGL